MSDLRDLYQELILDHGKTPRNFGCLANANHQKQGHNPLCGDELLLMLRINAQQVIEEISFQGNGCAISMASASLMTETVKGKTVEQVDKLFAQFHQLVMGESIAVDLGKLAAFSGVAEYPIRVKCATLAWHTLRASFNDASAETVVSTE